MYIPDGFKPLPCQVAGHTFQEDTGALGLLQDEKNRCILKPLGKPSCGERELSFYESLQRTNNKEQPLLDKLREFVPKFHTKVKLNINNAEHHFLKLEDLTYGMKKPCIMDIKIGKITWDPLSSPKKRAVEDEKYIGCKKTLGLCVPGFQVYQMADSKQVLKFGKEYGKKLDVNGFHQTIALFLNTKPKICRPLVLGILEKLYNIRNWFNVQTLFHFYASSLLITYDFDVVQKYFEVETAARHQHKHNSRHLTTKNGNKQNGEINIKADNHDNNDGDDDDDAITQVAYDGVLPAIDVNVKMIDFAHVFKSENATKDTNYLYGLENLINAIEELLK